MNETVKFQGVSSPPQKEHLETMGTYRDGGLFWT